MSYQVFARKWRPLQFSQIVGQAHVVNALTNAIEQNRLHHAYLFTGTRGVGKTTIARILAKALNCDSRTNFEPCCRCSMCLSVDEGRCVDLLEVDAASRTKVEDMRDLLGSVEYLPTEGRCKIYLIDEVHMLSGHSFNALLKTLEEPPDHVKFLLATTDPQKIPVTVLSRCLQFNLRRLNLDQIQDQLTMISKSEAIEAQPAALRVLSRSADGSMRDALSLLDQAIAYGGGKVLESDVLSMLGSVGQEPVFDLMTALASADPKAVLTVIGDLADHTPDFADVLQQLLMGLHRVALVQLAPETVGADESSETISNLAATMSQEDVQLFYQIGLMGQKDLPLAPDPKSGFEMVMLRMLAFKPAAIDSAAGSAGAGQSLQKSQWQEVSQTTLGEKVASTSSKGAVDDWLKMVRSLKVKGMVKELVMHCALHSVDGDSCILLLDPAHQQLLSDRIREGLEKALQGFFKKPIKLLIRLEKPKQETPAALLRLEQEQRLQQAESEIERDENVKAIKEAFNAQIVPGSIEPLE